MLNVNRLLLICFTLIQTSLARAESSEPVWTSGTLELPQVLQVVSADGVVSSFSTQRLGNHFSMYNDNSITMAENLISNCSRLLGKTTEELQLNANVSRRDVLGAYDPATGRSERTPVDRTGNAIIAVPAGANVFGECADGTSDLVQVTIQSSRPNEPRNLHDLKFEIIF